MTLEEKLEDLKKRCETAGFPYAYGKFEKPTPPPHLIAVIATADNVMADNIVYYKPIPIRLDYTYTLKDLKQQEKIENEILGDIAWNKTEEAYIQTEQVWQVSYYFVI